MAKRRKKTVKKPTQGIGFIMVDVANPNYNPAHDGERSNPKNVVAMMNPKESPVAWLHFYGNVTAVEYAAANRFRLLYERTGGGGVKGFDYTLEPVDGGVGPSDGLTQGRMDAAKELKGAYHKIGHNAYELVSLVCGDLVWIKDLESTRYMQKRRAAELKDALDCLATFWNLQSRLRNWRAA